MAAWTEGDETLEFASIGRMGTQRLRMDTLQIFIQNLVHGLRAGMETLLPAGMDFPNSHVHEFLDQPTGEIFFMDTQQSCEILDPLYQRFEDGHRNILTSLDSVIAWLGKAEHFLHLLLAALLASGGRTPKMDSIGGCRIRGSHRNILHISGSPVWADSLATGLQSYPSEVAWPLYLYIGIIRPFTFKILTARGALSELGRLSEHMFVHVFPLNLEERHWTRGDTNKVVDQFFGKPLGLELNHNDLRQILHHTINKHILPGIPTPAHLTQGTYNTMANHTDLTAGQYYAIDELSNFAADRPQTTHLLAISRAFYAWCQLVPTNQEPQFTGYSPSTLSNTLIQAASQRASLAIAKEYQLNCSDEVTLQHQLSKIIRDWKSTWFTLEERKEHFPSSEDQVLMEVLATLVFGDGMADYGGVNSSSSLAEELVVTALTLVSTSLDDVPSL